MEKTYKTFGIEKEVIHVPGAAGCHVPEFRIVVKVSEKSFKDIKRRGYVYELVCKKVDNN